jgi:hypothetical protein
MIAVSLKEGEELVKLFLQKGADVNAKSRFFSTPPSNVPFLFSHLHSFLQISAARYILSSYLPGFSL